MERIQEVDRLSSMCIFINALAETYKREDMANKMTPLDKVIDELESGEPLSQDAWVTCCHLLDNGDPAYEYLVYTNDGRYELPWSQRLKLRMLAEAKGGVSRKSILALPPHEEVKCAKCKQNWTINTGMIISFAKKIVLCDPCSKLFLAWQKEKYKNSKKKNKHKHKHKHAAPQIPNGKKLTKKQRREQKRLRKEEERRAEDVARVERMLGKNSLERD